LVIASGGWCLLHETNPPAIVLTDIAGVAIFVAAAAVDSAVKGSTVHIIALIAEFIGIFWIVRAIVVHTGRAQLVIKAHLMVIQHHGIRPFSTPIYQKMELYHHFLFFVGISFMSLLVVNVVLSSVDVAAWIIGLIEGIIQFIILVGVMFLYRPRGHGIDQYMRADADGDEASKRDEVLLEDLDAYDPTAEQEGMRMWEDGMELPLEPHVVATSGLVPAMAERKRSTDYTHVNQTPVQNK
jgi:hypothetical protein